MPRWSFAAIENDAPFAVCHICFPAAMVTNFVAGPSFLLASSPPLARNIGSVSAAPPLTFWGAAEETGGNNKEILCSFLRAALE